MEEHVKNLQRISPDIDEDVDNGGNVHDEGGEDVDNKDIVHDEGYEEQDDEEDQGGDGRKHGAALYDSEIMKIMKPYKRFLGVVASDRVYKLKPDANKDSAFIMNLDKYNKPGSHWIAVFISPKKSKSIEYYNSFGEEPSMEFLKQMKKVIDRMGLDYLLKLKVNRIKKQAERSSECGYYSMNFLMDRFKGLPFDDSTGYSDVMRSEGRIKRFRKMLKKRYPKFDFI